jgi:hypothetical protein
LHLLLEFSFLPQDSIKKHGIFCIIPKVVFRFWLLKEKLEDVKWLSEAIYLGTDNTMIQDNRQTMIYTTLHRKLEIEQSKSHKNERDNLEL